MTIRILLVEDDPTTRAYLVALLSGLPARIDTADRIASARALAGQATHDLWLVDAHLPDGSGIDLLAALRAQGLQARALAHTATTERETHAALLAAGYADVLCKPVDPARWLDTIRNTLQRPAEACPTVPPPPPRTGKLPVWNDDTAARALGGRTDHVASLRSLFLTELPEQRDAVITGTAATRDAHLHRLRASCALVGAARLEAAVQTLQSATAGHDADALQRFRDAADDTLAQPPVPPPA